MKILRTGEFLQQLFDFMNVPINDSLTDKDKAQLGDCIISAFFLSNFSPDKKFYQFFDVLFEDFYARNGINLEIDYRFALIMYLSAFNIKVETNHHEIGNGIFHAEIFWEDGQDTLSYVCENESMRFAKK